MKKGTKLMQIEIEELFIEGSYPLEAICTRVLATLNPKGKLAYQTNKGAWR